MKTNRQVEGEELKKRTNITIRFSVNVLKKLKEDIAGRKEINKYGCEALIDDYIKKIKGE